MNAQIHIAHTLTDPTHPKLKPWPSRALGVLNALYIAHGADTKRKRLTTMVKVQKAQVVNAKTKGEALRVLEFLYLTKLDLLPIK